MTITTNNQNKTITADTLKAVRSHARMSVALVLALQSFADDASVLNTDKKKERADNASATIGAKMLALKNSLPTEPGKLRMYVESIKQKVNAISESLTIDKTSFSNHCQRAAIIKQVRVALDNCDTFIAEYKELKGANLAQVAKVA